jgi:penicillin-binding protein 2
VPFDVVPNLDSNQVARFAEQLSGQPDLELETQPVRYYPWHTLAAHLLGFVQREAFDSGEVSYTLPDFAGRTGVERVFDSTLRGQSGIKLVLVNSLNYRQREDIETPNAPGDDVYLTIDLDIQRVAEEALAKAQSAPLPIRGAVVVMDVRNGDILAMVSTPAYDPNIYLDRLTPAESQALSDPKLTPQINRAIDGAYPPGSTFKIITTIACMENGLDPNELFDSPGFFQASARTHRIKDTAGAGKFDFDRAFFRSSNTYFIHYGMMAGLEKILAVARRFHLGEKTHFILTPEVAGDIPTPDKVGDTIQRSSTPDVCIGQEITTTPLQMAGMISAIANGGRIYWPRLVSRSFSPENNQYRELYAPGRLRDVVSINPHHLELIRHAMLDDTEHGDDPSVNGGGTAYKQFHNPNGELTLHNFRIAGKTGTAELKSKSPLMPHRITWFDSYGPYENPRYAVVVMVEDGEFGGPTCAPVAEKIYEEIVRKEQPHSQSGGRFARN